MLHWDLREGLAEARIEQLAAAARHTRPGRLRRSAGRILVTAGARLEGRAPTAAQQSAAAANTAAATRLHAA
jgi:hypothetical protein